MRGKPVIPLTATFAASAGLTTLVLELLWIRLAGIETGRPLAAFTLVVTCFMLGTAAGAFVLGRLADTTSSPLRLFGFTQIGVGLLGAITCLAAAGGGLARPILLHLGLEPGRPAFDLVLVLTHGVVACAGAFMAGGSLPLLVKRMAPGTPLTGRAGTLAAFHAAGGVAGALLCGFVLMPHAGLRMSLLGISAMAALTGLVAFRVGVPSPPTPTAGRPDPRVPAQGETGGVRLAVCAALLFSGSALTILEVAWTRLTALSFGSSAHAAGIVLALVIGGLAVGYAAGGRVAVGTSRPGRLLVYLLAGGALSIVAGDLVFGRLPAVVTWLETGSPGWRNQMVRFALLLAPIGLPSILLGAVYPLSLRLLSLQETTDARDGRQTGIASALSASGNMIGPPLAYFGIMGSLGSRGCLLLPAITLCLTALFVAATRRRPVEGWTRASLVPFVSIALTAATTVWLPWDPDLASSGPFLYAPYYRSAMDQSSSGLGTAVRRRGSIIFSHEGPDSLVTVRRSAGGILSLQVNGKTDASTGGDLKTQSMMAHLPLLLRAPRADESRPRLLIVGLGSGVTTAAALKHSVEQVDVMEISPGVVAAASLFHQTTGDLTSDPRMRLIMGDVRAHLLFAGADDPLYDVISSQPSNPWIAGQAILFTREFFALAASRLAPGGVVCQWLQGQGLSAADFRSILATFADVFPQVSLWEESNAGGDYLLLGSSEPIRIDEADLAARIREPRVAEALGLIEVTTPADLLAHHVASGRQLDELARGAVIQSEDRCSLEFTAPLTLHRETLGEILALLEPARSLIPDMIPPGGALANEMARRNRSAREEREWAAGLGLLAPSLQLDPDLVLAASYLQAGMRGHALEAVRSLTLKMPSQRTPHLMTAHLLMSMPGPRSSSELAEVIRELRTAVRLDPADPQARLFLSRALRAAGSLGEALVENAAIREPRPPGADSDRCAMFLESGDGASAEATCLEALSRDPRLATGHANLGVVRARRGRLREAEESYRRALDLDPTLVDARYNLAALYGRQGRDREGFEVLRALVTPSASGADEATLELAARLALGAGEVGQARACLSESLARGAPSPGLRELERLITSAEEKRRPPRR